MSDDIIAGLENVNDAIEKILAKAEDAHTDGLPVINDKKFEAESHWLCNGYGSGYADDAILDTPKGRLICGFIAAAMITVLLVLILIL